MSTTLAELQVAFDTRLASGVGAIGLEVAWEGVTYRPTVRTPYVAAKIASRAGTTMGIGPGVPRLWTGVYQLLVHYPIGEGMGPAYTAAGALLAHFPRGLGLALTTGSRIVYVERGSAGVAYTGADWIHVPVSLEWFCDELTA